MTIDSKASLNQLSLYWNVKLSDFDKTLKKQLLDSNKTNISKYA